MVTRCDGDAGSEKLNAFETSPLATEAATFRSSLLSTASKLETSKMETPFLIPIERRALRTVRLEGRGFEARELQKNDGAKISLRFHLCFFDKLIKLIMGK